MEAKNNRLDWQRVYRYRGEIISKAKAIELWVEHTREPLGPVVNIFSSVYDDAVHHNYVRDRLSFVHIHVTFVARRISHDRRTTIPN